MEVRSGLGLAVIFVATLAIGNGVWKLATGESMSSWLDGVMGKGGTQ